MIKTRQSGSFTDFTHRKSGAAILNSKLTVVKVFLSMVFVEGVNRPSFRTRLLDRLECANRKLHWRMHPYAKTCTHALKILQLNTTNTTNSVLH